MLKVVGETKGGLIVRGAKMIATAAPYAHDVLVMPHQKLNKGQEEYANMFIIPLNLPGLQIIVRPTIKKVWPMLSIISGRREIILSNIIRCTIS